MSNIKGLRDYAGAKAAEQRARAKAENKDGDDDDDDDAPDTSVILYKNGFTVGGDGGDDLFRPLTSGINKQHWDLLKEKKLPKQIEALILTKYASLKEAGLHLVDYSSHDHDGSGEVAHVSDPLWKCVTCTLENKYEDIKCVVCDADRPPIVIPPVPAKRAPAKSAAKVATAAKSPIAAAKVASAPAKTATPSSTATAAAATAPVGGMGGAGRSLATEQKGSGLSSCAAAIAQLDTSPTLSIQIVLPSRAKVAVKLNHTHTVAQLYAHAKAVAAVAGDFNLSNGFPPRVLRDGAITVKAAGLEGASISMSLL